MEDYNIFFSYKQKTGCTYHQVPVSKSDGSKLTTVTKYSVQVLSVQELP